MAGRQEVQRGRDRIGETRCPTVGKPDSKGYTQESLEGSRVEKEEQGKGHCEATSGLPCPSSLPSTTTRVHTHTSGAAPRSRYPPLPPARSCWSSARAG